VSNAFAICVNKRQQMRQTAQQLQQLREERKKFLLSVQSVREIENCSLVVNVIPSHPPSLFSISFALALCITGYLLFSKFS